MELLRKRFFELNMVICTLVMQLSNSSTVGEDEVKDLREDISKLMRGEFDFSASKTPRMDDLMDVTPRNHDQYDFIVIGAGSAGATIAARLSEANVSVLLIEAGSRDHPIMYIPGLAMPLGLNKGIDWNYEIESSSDKFCLGFKESRCHAYRGKVMGGTNMLNYLLATRGNRKDYDTWAQVSGDDSWSYKNFLQYLKKLENFKINEKTIVKSPEFHSTKGPVPITGTANPSKLTRAFMRAGKELGYSEVDYNGARQIGISYLQLTIDGGERQSASRAYLYRLADRHNLHVTRGSHVNKIIIDKETKTARGVRFTKHNETIEVSIRKEIILCAGAINSPTILMLSGIGPENHLSDLDIDIVKDAPVGENLMDHVGFNALIFKVNDSETYNHLDLLDPRNPALREYVNKREGPLTSIISEALAYVNVDDENSTRDDPPNIELLFGEGQGSKDPVFSKLLGVRDEYRDQMNADVFNHSTWAINAVVLKPKSRGKILLRSKDPYDAPKIALNYFDNEDDMRVLLKGIQTAFKFSRTEALQKYGSQLYNIPSPCNAQNIGSDAYWECLIRFYTLTMYHYSGTCKMGRRNDPSSVVDPRLRVIGVNRLRVADASIMPEIVGAHINIPVIAIGEKAADMIKYDWRLL